MISRLLSNIRSLLSNRNRVSEAVSGWGGTVIFTSVVVTAVLVGVRQIGALQPLELSAFDQLMRWRPDEGPDPRLLVVGVTEEDLLKEYPISDQTIANLLDKLNQYQPRGIGLDIFREISRGKGRDALKQSLQKPNITVVCKASQSNNPGVPPPPELSKEQVGFADMPEDRGGTLRRSLLVMNPPKPDKPWQTQHLCNDPSEQLTSFALQLAMFYLEPQGIKPEQTNDDQIKMGSTVLKRLQASPGRYQGDDVLGYQLLLNYRSPKQVSQQVSLSDVLNGKIDPKLVRDRVVLIGYVAPSIKDNFFTPYSAGLADDQKMPGVVVHAQIVSQILSTVLNNRPLFWFWPQWGEVLWILGWSLVGGIVAARVRNPWQFALVGGATLGVLVAICYGLFLLAAWVPLVPPALAVVGTAVGVVLVDRFNKSEYGQAFYEGVKGVLKLNIEIDQAKTNAEVAEITGTEFFQELQQKAKARKNQKDKFATEEAAESNSQPKTAQQHDQATEPVSEENDYFQRLQQKGKSLRHPENQSNDADQVSESVSEENDYFQQLQQRGKSLKNPKNQSNDTDQATESVSEENDYFQRLQQKGKSLRNQDDQSDESGGNDDERSI